MQVPPIDDAALRDLLGQTLVAKVATHDGDGEIRITPVVFEARDDGSIRFNTFENSALVKNLKRDPKCSVLIDTTHPYPDGVDPGVGVHYWGTGEVEHEGSAQEMGEMFAPYVDGDVEKATAYAEKMKGFGKRVFVRFRPERDVSWDFTKA